MNCEEAKLKVQALTDNELSEDEIESTLQHIENCYKCRNLYKELITLKKGIKGMGIPEPSREWFEDLEKKSTRRTIAGFGKGLFIVSYILLLLYAVYSVFIEKETNLVVKISILGILLGIVILLGITIADRIREAKTDRYKEVMK